jgi:hypothetical protein
VLTAAAILFDALSSPEPVPTSLENAMASNKKAGARPAFSNQTLCEISI